MTKGEYLYLREKMYEEVGLVGYHAEITEAKELCEAYDKACLSLDAIDNYGVLLGYIDPETNEVRE